MKKLTLLSLIGITSIVLAHAGWAAGHGGGGGGFGGGGFHGGGFRGGGLVAVSVQCEAGTPSAAAELVRGVAATGVAIGAITDSLMMTATATSEFHTGGPRASPM